MGDFREGILRQLDEYVRPGHSRPKAWEGYNNKQLLQTLYALEQLSRPVREMEPPLFNPHLHPDWVEQNRKGKANGG